MVKLSEPECLNQDLGDFADFGGNGAGLYAYPSLHQVIISLSKELFQK
jgi:hypothetical protein